MKNLNLNKDTSCHGSQPPEYTSQKLPLQLSCLADKGLWSTSYPGCFTLGTQYIGGWIYPRASLDILEKWKISYPARNLTPERPPRSPVTIPATWSWLTPHHKSNTNSASYLPHKVALSGLVVSVLATGPKVRGFHPDRGRWILKGDKNPEHHFLRRGSKAVGPMS
jgi:hypothetical protein